MSDWRLNGQEEYLANKTLYKVTFPDFWQIAYRDKNAFYQKVERCAQNYVNVSNRAHEYLEGEKIQHLWHDHCEFCFEKAMTDKVGIFYCTEDLTYWICEKCFQDFREKFNWQEKTWASL